MKKLHLEININASPEVVWNAVVTDEMYRKWTDVFQPGSQSHFEGGWNKGDAIRFIGLNDKGEKEGMVSEIAESTYPEYISIRHLGFIMNGVEDTTSDAIKKWAPSYENYTFKKNDDGTTTFILDMDATEEFYQIFSELWPKALQALKTLCESKG